MREEEGRKKLKKTHFFIFPFLSPTKKTQPTQQVKSIAAQFVKPDAVCVFVGQVEDRLVANTSIAQHVDVMGSMGGGSAEKMPRLRQLLQSKPPGTRIIIFCSTKRMCDQLAMGLGRDFRAAAIHGDKQQRERDWVLASFKSGQCPIMIATDVAARGLDVPDVGAVINYDFPNGVEDYIHRIGRTGRAGNTGEAYTFFTPADSKHAGQLCRVLREGRPCLRSWSRWRRTVAAAAGGRGTVVAGAAGVVSAAEAEAAVSGAEEDTEADGDTEEGVTAAAAATATRVSLLAFFFFFFFEKDHTSGKRNGDCLGFFRFF